MNKKTRRRFFVGAGVLILLFGVFFLVIKNTLYKELKKMSPLETHEVIKGVFALRDDYVNMFLIKQKTGYIGIDAGKDGELLKKQLQRLNIRGEEVTHIFLTHSDYDHAGGVEAFPGAKIYLPEKEVRMVDGTISRSFCMKNKLERKYTSVRGGENIRVGGLKLRFVELPGHTPGSTGIIINEEMIFTGDALGLINNKIVNFGSFFNMDMETHLKSIEKLKKTELPKLKYLFSAHHGFLELMRGKRK